MSQMRILAAAARVGPLGFARPPRGAQDKAARAARGRHEIEALRGRYTRARRMATTRVTAQAPRATTIAPCAVVLTICRPTCMVSSFIPLA